VFSTVFPDHYGCCSG